MIILFSAPVSGVNTLLSTKSAWKINDLSTENWLDPVLNYTEKAMFAKCHMEVANKGGQYLLHISSGKYRCVNKIFAIGVLTQTAPHNTESPVLNRRFVQ